MDEGKPRSKRKKAARACEPCQRAHLTCEDARPCSRCVKRGLEESCRDGRRKKAKYLRDVDDEAINAKAEVPPPLTRQTSDSTPSASHSPIPTTFPQPGPLYSQSEYVSPLDFESYAANQEYNALANTIDPPAFAVPVQSTSSLPVLSFPTAQLFANQMDQGPVPSISSGIWQGLAGLSGNEWNQQPDAPSSRMPSGAMRVEDVYRSVTQPYHHSKSYDNLIKHIKHRYDKADILRIVRAIAVFRPSILALQMPLTEEDEIFIEKCCQRELIELEKLISFTGTPTCVWRRTGEIVLVGIEFAALTKWDRYELVRQDKKKFIFELMDAASVVEYYEAFAKHAFETATQAITSTCVLLTPTGLPVPCSFSVTIKRDLFHCPSLVVGSFLPLDTEV